MAETKSLEITPNYKILLIEELATAGNKKAMLEMARYYIDQKKRGSG